jgi:pimeloyl-ACP methyl ester carboxylesterase
MRRRVWRGFKFTFLALALAALAASLVFHSWVGAQARVVTVLSTTIHTPVLTWLVKVVTPDPRVSDRVVAGQPATVARPDGKGRWPAIVFVNGATRRGRLHPKVQRLTRGLARAGYLAVVPDLPGLSYGEISARTVDALVAVALSVTNRPDVRKHGLTFLGVSVGATLSLLAAEKPELAGRIRLVAGIAPYTSLRRIIRLATTGTYAGAGRLVRYDADPYVRLAIGRSLAVALPPGRDRRALVSDLERVGDSDPRPLAALRRAPPPLGSSAGRAVVDLLSNRDPARFGRLYARLPAPMRAEIAGLSPLAGARRLRARVEIASAPHDKYFPVEESRSLAQAATDTDVSTTVTRTLSHAIPEPSFGAIGDLFRFDGFVVRVLKEAGE